MSLRDLELLDDKFFEGPEFSLARKMFDHDVRQQAVVLVLGEQFTRAKKRLRKTRLATTRQKKASIKLKLAIARAAREEKKLAEEAARKAPPKPAPAAAQSTPKPRATKKPPSRTRH